MSKITMKNISSGTVIVAVPDISFRRELLPNRVVPVTQDEYNSLVFDPGVDALIQGHYIKFDGVEEDEAPVTASPIYEASNIKKMLEDEDVAAFTRFLPKATEAEKESVIKLATDLKVTNNAFIALIKKYCGVDIMSAINIQHQLSE